MTAATATRPQAHKPAGKAGKMTKAQLEQALAEREQQLAALTAGKPASSEPTAADRLKEFTESQGLQFARGGRTHWTLQHLQSAVQVLQSGEPALVPLNGVANLLARGVTHLAIGLADDKQSVLTQYVYDPAPTGSSATRTAPRDATSSASTGHWAAHS